LIPLHGFFLSKSEIQRQGENFFWYLLDKQYYMTYNIVNPKKKRRAAMYFSLGGILLDGCVLAVLSRGDAYGYALTQSLQKVAPISESTLYPVLRRLQKEQYL